MSSAASHIGPNPSAAEQPAATRRDRTDSLGEGIFLVLALTVVQRIVGFLRGILFCRWLTPEELGYWDLSFSFILLAAPLAVLGIPGSFGRYVEHYRQRGQLRAFLRRTAICSAWLGSIGCILLWGGRDFVSWMVFGDAGRWQLTASLIVGLLAIIAFNFIVSLYSALRQMRIVTGLHLAHSLLFAGLGLGLLCFWKTSAASVVIAYGSACLITVCWVIPLCASSWIGLGPEDRELPQRALWGKLIPFAAWVWATNILANVFVIVDRYMIIHFSGLDADQAATLVGNYHSSRVVPVLMVAVSALLGGVILPHLSHDWEAGRRQQVSHQLNLILKLMGISLTMGGCLILLAAPLIFGWMLGDKYDGGLSVLPWVIQACIWFSLCLVAQNYLWCAERASFVSLAYALGLAANLLLNLLLLPILGLLGAVLATAAAMAIALGAVHVASTRLGMRREPGTCLALMLPLSLGGGPWVAGAAVVVVLAISLGPAGWFTEEDRQLLREVLHSCAKKIRPGR